MKNLLKILLVVWIGGTSAQTISNAFIFNNPTVITNGQLTPTFLTSVSSATINNSITFGAGASSPTQTGTQLCWPALGNSSPPVGSNFYTSMYYMGGGADFFQCTGRALPVFEDLMEDNSAGNSAQRNLYNSTGDGPQLRVQTAATTSACFTVRTALLAAGPCVGIFADGGGNNYPLTIAWAHASSQILFTSQHDRYLVGNTNSTSLIWADATWVSSTQQTLVLGDSQASSTTTIQAGASNIFLTNVTTGTNADTLCMSATGAILLQAAPCTISSERFKTEMFPLADAEPIMRLQPIHFTMKYQGKPNPDPNFSHAQVGLTAENVAAVVPDCAVYENDMKTPKSYRPECIDAFLVKVVQDHQRELVRDKLEIYLLALWCLIISGHAGFLHIKSRRV